ncbi:hypothetical protein [Cohnella silvisoli]|uniref:Uncharacterized protein n=1 Tax=Cohnella silvisoli TaxID=2873699 RepID=A0ABV1L0M1_9BACL|nr:hypothetical protein [Cohnella silvisoli]MCD9025078.1 hypothetical protein [Cohnella silvisoli]
MNEIPIACCHTVFTKDERSVYKDIWSELEKRRLAVTEVQAGFEYQFPGDLETLRLVNEWVSMERKCCPFLTFTVIASSEDEPVFLQLTGNEEAKAFLRSEINDKIALITTIGSPIPQFFENGSDHGIIVLLRHRNQNCSIT